MDRAAELASFILEYADLVHPAPVGRPANVAPFSKEYIWPQLWLGSRQLAENPAALRMLRVSHVVNCAASQVPSPLLDVYEEGYRDVSYCLLHLDDAPRVVSGRADCSPSGGDESRIEFDPKASEAFERAAGFIEDALQDQSVDDGMGGPVVFAHCAGGVSRSCSAVLAYLVSRLHMPLRDAYGQVKTARPVIGPNAGFFHILLDIEQRTLGVETMVRPLTLHQRGYRAIVSQQVDESTLQPSEKSPAEGVGKGPGQPPCKPGVESVKAAGKGSGTPPGKSAGKGLGKPLPPPPNKSQGKSKTPPQQKPAKSNSGSSLVDELGRAARRQGKWVEPDVSRLGHPPPLLARFVARESDAGNTPPSTRILAFGDSLTAGFCKGGQEFEPYGNKLASALDLLGMHAEVIVCGLSGRTAAYMASKLGTGDKESDLHELLESYGPFTVALIMAGSNDLSCSAPDAILKNLVSLHTACQERGVASLALAIPCSWVASREGFGRDARETTNRLLAEWAGEVKVDFLDTEELVPWSRHSTHWDRDGLHLSPAGSRQLGHDLAPNVLARLLRNRQATVGENK